MIFIAAIEAAALLATLVALVLIVRMLLASHREAEAAWTVERRELVNRVQAPERIPVALPEGMDFPEPEVDEMAMVGQIVYDEHYGEDE